MKQTREMMGLNGCLIAMRHLYNLPIGLHSKL